MSDDIEEVYEDVRTPLQRKKEKLMNIAVIITIVNVASALFIASSQNREGANFLGYAAAPLMLPFLLVGLSQIVPVFRNGYIRLHVYLWSATLHTLGALFLVLLIRGSNA